MKYLLNSQEMKTCDAFTINQMGVPSMVLMERAALAVAAVIKERFGAPRRVLVFCGSGNNGGDGFAVARLLLLDGIAADVFFAGKESSMTADCALQKKIFENYGGKICRNWEPDEYTVLVDALFGIGLSRPITGEYAELIEKINASGLPVAAVDIPSGISADTGHVMGRAVNAQITVTFAFPKRGQIFYPGSAYCGELMIKDIGITGHGISLSWNLPFYYEQEDLKYLPVRTARSNKGSYGRAAIIGGASGMAGAVVLAAKAAYRTGCGLVQVFSDEDNRNIVQTAVPEALFVPWQKAENLSKLLSWATVIAIGPGLGTSDYPETLLREVLERWEGPLIMDADALNILAKHPEYLENTKAKIIITPHPGEMSRLIRGDKEAERLKAENLKTENLKAENLKAESLRAESLDLEGLKSESEVSGCQICSSNGGSIPEILDHLPETAESYARAHKVVCVLKDARTVVSDGEQIYVNVSGNNGMSVGGSGDVLTGILVGLTAQGMKSFQGVCLGVYLHGLAGDAAKKRLGVRSMLAGDIVEGICEVLKNTAE